MDFSFSKYKYKYKNIIIQRTFITLRNIFKSDSVGLVFRDCSDRKQVARGTEFDISEQIRTF